MKRLTTLIITGALAAGTLAGCAGTSTPTATTSTDKAASPNAGGLVHGPNGGPYYINPPWTVQKVEAVAKWDHQAFAPEHGGPLLSVTCKKVSSREYDCTGQMSHANTAGGMGSDYMAEVFVNADGTWFGD